MRRDAEIRLDAPAKLIAAADHIVGLEVLLTGSEAEPAQGGLGIAANAVTVEQHVTPADLGRGHPGKGRAKHPSRAELGPLCQPFPILLGAELHHDRREGELLVRHHISAQRRSRL
jgi:hypothetical protein